MTIFQDDRQVGLVDRLDQVELELSLATSSLEGKQAAFSELEEKLEKEALSWGQQVEIGVNC